MASSIQKGDALEDAIYKLFCREIEAGRFPLKSESCKIFKKRDYYSKDREAFITFDVAIEVYLPGSNEYFFVFLIECKNYNSPVPIGDVEEFDQKSKQVACAKSKLIVASTNSFQSSVRSYAKSKGISLLRYFDAENFKWELQRSTSASEITSSGISRFELEEAFSQTAYRSRVFDIFFESESGLTVSLWEFFENSLVASGVERDKISLVFNSQTVLEPMVPYLEKIQLEGFAQSILNDVGYQGREVDLNAICDSIPDLTVELYDKDEGDVLGCVSFSPLIIKMFGTASPYRDRFTLAHEISHILLGHGQYISKDVCESSDLENLEPSRFLPRDIKRIEYQANYLAACLLMPKENFFSNFLDTASTFGIKNRGFGPLFLDHQTDNRSDYMRVTQRLMSLYSVSRAAVHIRLQTLGLLNDAR